MFLLLSLTGCSENIPPSTATGSENESSETTEPVFESTEFSVLIYNVENIFDIDEVALFRDYKQALDTKSGYGPLQFRTKLLNLVEVIKTIDEGKGPDLILFQEFEGDQTPNANLNVEEIRLDPDRPKVADLLLGDVPESYRDLPAYVWTWMALDDAGLDYPYVVSSDYVPPPSADDGPVHANATFSRFPITSTQSHVLQKARSILEATIQIGEFQLTTFNNHWKSGASRQDTEQIRVQNAGVLRSRLDELLQADRYHDVIVGGDLNSHYNQNRIFPDWDQTGVNDVLGSQGVETGLFDQQKADLYNLWFELPLEERGSELYRNTWGTLMQILLTPGLYDEHGIQYIDQSFKVVRIPDLNENPVTGAPFRWMGVEEGTGYSDHFPLLARYRTVNGQKAKPMPLDNPSRSLAVPDTQTVVDLSLVDLSQAKAFSDYQTRNDFEQVSSLGQFVRLEGLVLNGDQLQIESQIGPIDLWIPNREFRNQFKADYETGEDVIVYGQVGWYRGNWQVVLSDPAWLK
ncbi:MAG: endonuclease/exonuclease/phosphatase family protein [Verrucomicrobiota bacterium]